MRASNRFLFKLLASSITLMPLFAHADIPAKECPRLLTEMECNDFQQTQQQIKSPVEREVFEHKYAVLMHERAQLCRCPVEEEIARPTRATLPAKPFKSYNGRGSSIMM